MIRIQNLSKRFGALQVLKSIDLTITRGKITAIVGPNGSGKTTLIKCILGLVRQESGTICLDDVCVNGTWGYRREIGYMPQSARFPENLTVRELIEMVRDLRNGGNVNEVELIGTFRLGDEIKKPVRTLSGGTRQKVSAVLALMFDPKILVLDEPTAGLEPLSSSRLKDRILAEKARGKTIILTSHNMSDVEELSDNIVFLLDGVVYFQGSTDELKAHTGESNLERGIARMMESNDK